MIIIPHQELKLGDTVAFDGGVWRADKHVSNGAELKGSAYTHMMFTRRGAFAMVAHEA